MNKQYKVFTEVAPFYQDLLDALGTAENKISMMYFTYDAGDWTRKMNTVLYSKVEQGVEVKIMVDLVGFFTDNATNIFKNIRQVGEMRRKGIQFDFFQPGKGSNMTPVDRLHFKLCAIDEKIAYIGGSNIADHYTTWQDTNLRVQGEIGNVGHQLYEYVLAHSDGKQEIPELDLDALNIGDAKLLLTVPGAREDISKNWIDLIETTRSKIYFRNWYFLPNKKYMKAMIDKLELGVEIEVLLSHRTRVPVIDVANHAQSRKLVRSGANIYRYQSRYMHSKVTWNSENEILFGSANLEEKALKGNFELCLRFNDREISDQLTKAYNKDIRTCLHQSPKVVEKRAFPKRMASKLFSLATPLL
jgi:cardiolipin synthase